MKRTTARKSNRPKTRKARRPSARRANSPRVGAGNGAAKFRKGARVQIKKGHWTGMGVRGGVVMSSGAYRTTVRFDDGVLSDVDSRSLCRTSIPKRANPRHDAADLRLLANAVARIMGGHRSTRSTAAQTTPEAILAAFRKHRHLVYVAEHIVTDKAMARDVPGSAAKMQRGIKELSTYLAKANPAYKGSVVNAEIAKPRPPGFWVNEKRCEVCGLTYAAHRAPVGNQEALQLVRQANKAEGDDGGGYRSRGPMLWARKVLKLEHWYETHALCGGEVRQRTGESQAQAMKRLTAAKRSDAAKRAKRRGSALNTPVITSNVEDYL